MTRLKYWCGKVLWTLAAIAEMFVLPIKKEHNSAKKEDD